MKRLVITVACLSLSIAAASQRMGPNPYLVRPAPTLAELLSQVRTNPVVFDRFSRHFQLSKEPLLEMLSGLRKVALEQDAVFEMWNVPAKTGELRSRRLTLRKGETVWVNAVGTPILKVSCGNPLTRTDEPSEPPVRSTLTSASGVKPVAAPGGTEVEEMVAPAPVEPLLPAMPGPEFVEIPAPSEMIAITETQPARFDFGSAIAFMPSLLFSIRGDDWVIPEPATILALGGAASLLLARRAKRKSR